MIKEKPHCEPEKPWTGAPLLYFHFNSANGGFASLPMHRVLYAFDSSFTGIPGTREMLLPFGKTTWIVPGYKCCGCAKVFFAATKEDLKHDCMNNGGVISASQSMGANGCD